MDVAIFFFAFVGSIFAGPVLQLSNSNIQTYFLYKRSDGSYEIEDLTKEPTKVDASESDITYYFYSWNDTAGVAFQSTDVNNLQTRTNYNTSKETFFIIHGWQNDNQSDVNTEVKNALLTAGDFNVFVVDWSSIASENYVTAQSSVLSIGNLVGAFIQQLNTLFGQSFDTLTVAGHSLGAHVAGNAGAACGGQIATLVGMDPAGPLFLAVNTDNRLDPTDGVRVEIIHTNGGELGYFDTLGHVDYYVNGGLIQPGCETDLTGSCSHSRSHKYYAESLTDNKFLARACGSYLEYETHTCDGNETCYMGGYPITTANGTYYLKTNSDSPYGQGIA